MTKLLELTIPLGMSMSIAPGKGVRRHVRELTTMNCTSKPLQNLRCVHACRVCAEAY